MPESGEELPVFKKKESVDNGDGLPVLKKKESTSSQSLLENGTSSSTTGASESIEKLPPINESLNPPGVLEQPEKLVRPNEPAITVPQGENNLDTAPTYATTKEVNAPGTSLSESAKALQSGVSTIGAIAARTPAYTNDFINRATNTVLNTNLKTDLANQPNAIAENFEQIAKDASAASNKDYVDKDGNVQGAYDLLSKGEVGKGLGKLMNNVIETLPVSAAIVGAGALGVPTAGIIAGGTMAFGSQEKQNLLEKNEENKKQGLPTMSDEDINAVSLISGTLEGVTEAAFGNIKFGQFYRDLVKKEGLDGAKAIVEPTVKEVLKKGFGRYGGTVLEEGASEGANQYLDNLNHIYVGGDKEIKPWDNVMESVLTGLGSAGAMGSPLIAHTPIKALQVARTKAEQIEAQKHADNQQALKQQLNDPNNPPEVKQAASNALHESFNQEDELTKKIQKEHNDLPVEKQNKVNEHLVSQMWSHKAINAINNRSDITKEQKEAAIQPHLDSIDRNDRTIEDIKKENEKIIAERDKEKEKHEEQGLTDYDVKDFAGAHKDIEKEIQEELAKEKEKQEQEALILKKEKDATKKRKIERDNQRKHQNGDEGGKTTEASNRNSDEQGGNEQKQEEVKHLIVAHAPTETTEKNITSSVSKEPLSEKGEVIAEKIGEQAKAEGVKTIVTDSETTRNKETAEKAAEISGAKVEQVDNLHTWDKGEFASIDSKDWKKSEKYFIDHPDQTEHDGKKLNESFNDFFDRYTKAKRDAKENSDGKTLFVGSSTGIRIEQALESANGEWTKKAKEHFLNNSIEHEGEIEDNPDADHPAQEQLDRLDKDIESFKGIKPENIIKKYTAVNSRIDDLVENKLIGKRTANAYKKVFQDIYDQKIKNIKEGITKVGENIKKEILGQYKGKVFSSLLPGTPQMVSDLIDLGVKFAHIYVDANYSIQEAVQKALEKMKKSPLYEKLSAAGVLDKKQLEKELIDKLGKAKPIEEEIKPEEIVKEGDVSGEKRKRSIGKRILEQNKFKNVSKRLKEKGIDYTSVSQLKATQVANSIIEEHEKENSLVDLADSIISGETDIPYNMQGLVAAKLTDRLNVIAEKEINDFTKQSTFDKSAELAMWWAEKATEAGQFNGVVSAEISNSLPSSKESLRTFANKELEKLHDKILSKEEKVQVEQVTKEINNLFDEDNLTTEQLALLDKLVTKKIDEIYSEINGKEHIEKVNKLQSLIMDLTDC